MSETAASAAQARSEEDRAELEAVARVAQEDKDQEGGSEERQEMPLPHDPRTVIQAGLLLIGVLFCLYVAREFILPVVLALVLKLLLQPLVRLLERVHVPKALGALFAIALLLAVFVGLGMLLSAPAANWATSLPKALPQLEQRFAFLQAPTGRLQQTLGQMGVHFDAQNALSSFQPTTWITAVFSGTGTVASGMLESILILFYLLVFGEIFLRRAVEILPRFQDKREAVELSLHIERDLSAYLLTITIINAIVGTATGIVMWLTGVPGPPLWGVAAFCLNYVPILGPLCGVVFFAFVGLLTKGAEWWSLLPAALYLCIHLTEGELITPMILSRRFTINPVAVMLALTFWYWMWGIPGAILAVPMLAITKIVCDRLRPLRALGHFLEA
jgi:predicted PurR-regulated permease PerM